MFFRVGRGIGWGADPDHVVRWVEVAAPVGGIMELCADRERVRGAIWNGADDSLRPNDADGEH